MTDPTALPNFPPPADEHPLRGRMLDVINDLGTLPAIDDDGDIAITVGEPPQQLFVRCTDGDFPIFRVFGQWVIGDAAPADERERLERCNDFTLQLNVAKVGIANGNLIVTADHVVMPETDLSTLFQLTVNLVLQVVSAWFGSWDQGRHEAPETGG
ncbi:MAG: hypothetical protein KBF43_10095 [Dermatophilaceae bacterium]|jgi:hypothetical protein|nr:hypothetical protein [Actinomycetales bacterium]MBP8879988.1 hypothetical protein [Dermatophilaceae bacterium]MBP9918923.1 hypothetical protein [Dermatophilaceae bacterium]